MPPPTAWAPTAPVGDRWSTPSAATGRGGATLAMDPVLGSIVHHPLSMTRFGMLAGLPATVLGRLFSGRDARSLLAGMAAHSGTPLSSLTSGE